LLKQDKEKWGSK